MRNGRLLKRLARTGPAALLASLVPPANAADLLLVEQPGCAWCRHVNAEIAPAWPNTEEGRRAPMRRVDISQGWPADLAHIRPEHLTPTFILIDGDTEVGRLRGYPGDHFFWPVIGELIARLRPAGS